MTPIFCRHLEHYDHDISSEGTWLTWPSFLIVFLMESIDPKLSKYTSSLENFVMVAENEDFNDLLEKSPNLPRQTALIAILVHTRGPRKPCLLFCKYSLGLRYFRCLFGLSFLPRVRLFCHRGLPICPPGGTLINNYIIHLYNC